MDIATGYKHVQGISFLLRKKAWANNSIISYHSYLNCVSLSHEECLKNLSLPGHGMSKGLISGLACLTLKHSCLFFIYGFRVWILFHGVEVGRGERARGGQGAIQ